MHSNSRSWSSTSALRLSISTARDSVEEILDQWYGPNELLFKVRAKDGDIYILRHDEREDEWSLESSRRAL
jgi:hypothetical protein